MASTTLLRGDRRGAIYRDDTDLLAWQQVLVLVCERHHFIVHSFCQITNHYYLLVETVEANLSQGMRQLNGLYTQHFNRRHKLVGRVLQGKRPPTAVYPWVPHDAMIEFGAQIDCVHKFIYGHNNSTSYNQGETRAISPSQR